MSMRVIVVLCQKDADSYRIWRYMQLPVYGYFATLTKLFPSSRLLTTLTTWPLGGYIMIGIFFLLPIVVGLSIIWKRAKRGGSIRIRLR